MAGWTCVWVFALPTFKKMHMIICKWENLCENWWLPAET